MTSHSFFPTLTDFEPTRQTLHNYSHAIGVIPRIHGVAHPQWWHISLKVRPDGLTTDHLSLPDGGVLVLRMDLHEHKIVLQTSHGKQREFSMRDGMTGTEMGGLVITAVSQYGLEGEYDRARFESDIPREYDPETVHRYFTALVNTDRAFKNHKTLIGNATGPVQVWPHGFDLAFEWFGSRVERHEKHGEIQESPAQLNLGFYPGSEGVDPYFYSNPWPFEGDMLLGKPLPEGASWHTEGWQGTILPYQELVGDVHAEARLLAYAKAVHDLAAPTLTADS